MYHRKPRLCLRFLLSPPLRAAVVVTAAILVPIAGVRAQQDPSHAIDAAAFRALLERVGQLELRVKTLEMEKSALLAQRSAEAGPPPEEQAGMSHSTPPRAESWGPRLRIRGFADVGWTTSSLHGTTNSFSLGQFNLFVTSRLSDKLSVLAEAVMEADSGTNQLGIELERMLLLYNLNDYLNLSLGRYHNSIAFYNTAYHHSAWLQTTTNRPFLFAFEDGGGILPIHNVGVSATGRIPSGVLGLHYVAEIGNGRSTRTALGNNPVQNVADENHGKSFKTSHSMRARRPCAACKSASQVITTT